MIAVIASQRSKAQDPGSSPKVGGRIQTVRLSTSDNSESIQHKIVDGKYAIQVSHTIPLLGTDVVNLSVTSPEPGQWTASEVDAGKNLLVKRTGNSAPRPCTVSVAEPISIDPALDFAEKTRKRLENKQGKLTVVAARGEIDRLVNQYGLSDDHVLKLPRSAANKSEPQRTLHRLCLWVSYDNLFRRIQLEPRPLATETDAQAIYDRVIKLLHGAEFPDDPSDRLITELEYQKMVDTFSVTYSATFVPSLFESSPDENWRQAPQVSLGKPGFGQVDWTGTIGVGRQSSRWLAFPVSMPSDALTVRSHGGNKNLKWTFVSGDGAWQYVRLINTSDKFQPPFQVTIQRAGIAGRIEVSQREPADVEFPILILFSDSERVEHLHCNRIAFVLGTVLSVMSVCCFGQDTTDYLPGELPVLLDGQLVEATGVPPVEATGVPLVEATGVPSLTEIVKLVDSPRPKTVVVVRLFGDQNNHFGPMWSMDGRNVAFLRSDLDLGTRKVITQRLGYRALQKQPINATTLYQKTTSFEDLASWSVGDRNLLVFDSTHQDDGGHNVHQTTIGSPPDRITDGTGVLDFPAIHADARGSVLVFRRDRELFLANYRPDELKAKSMESIGEGEEAAPSRDGRFLAIVRRNEIGDEYKLVIRELRGVREKTLYSAADAIIRNPRFSPNGRALAFHSRLISENRWSLWWVPINGSRKAAKIADEIRVQEDFRHIGPSWNPDSTGLWVFNHSGDQAHYPLRFAPLTSKSAEQLAYPDKITSASEASMNPNPRRPIILFAGHTSKPRDIFALVMSRVP